MPAHETFDVRVGNSRFTSESIALDIDTPEGRVQGEIQFNQRALFPSNLWMPGIMGPFAWIPAMECYHGLISLDHHLTGTLTVDGEAWDFSGGRGYIEKDWGTNFPSAYVWMQSNHFTTPGTSGVLTASTTVAEGGSISVTSQPKQGTTFVITLSAETAGEVNSGDTRLPRPQTNLEEF